MMRAVIVALLLTGCDGATQGNEAGAAPAAAPFRYHGRTLRLPAGSVEALVPEGLALGPWARLIPDAPASGDAIDARYAIDLGRAYTGQNGPNGMGLGAAFYPADAVRTALGDGYTLYCPAGRREPAYDCAALLHALPFAAIQFRAEPASAEAARGLVGEAEAYLARAASPAPGSEGIGR